MSSRKMIWIIEDDPGVLFTYREIFRDRYDSRFFETLGGFSAALLQESQEHPDFLITDLRLPDGNFLDYLTRESSAQTIHFPFLIISSCADEDVLHACFDEGAIDYLTKPFTKGELLAKVSRYLEDPASFRLNRPLGESVGIRVNFESLCIEDERGGRVALTPKELQILNFIKCAPEKKASRSEIIRKTWHDTSVTPKTFDVHLFNLRRKLQSLGWTLVFIAPDSYTLQPIETQ